MELIYDFSEEYFLELCLKNLARKKTTVFEDLYETIRHFMSTPGLCCTNLSVKAFLAI